MPTRLLPKIDPGSRKSLVTPIKKIDLTEEVIKKMKALLESGELHAGSIERLAIRPGVSLLGGALGLVGRVGEGEDDRPLVEPAHRLDDPLAEGAALGMELLSPMSFWQYYRNPSTF